MHWESSGSFRSHGDGGTQSLRPWLEGIRELEKLCTVVTDPFVDVIVVGKETSVSGVLINGIRPTTWVFLP